MDKTAQVTWRWILWLTKRMTWIHYISNYKWWPSICLFYIYVLLFALFFFLSFTTDDLDWFGVVSRWRLRSSWQLYILLQNMYRYIYIYKSIAGWTHTRNDMRKKRRRRWGRVENGGGGICWLVTHSSLVRLLAAMDAVRKFFFLALSISSFLLGPHAEYLGVIPQYLTAPPYSLYCSRTLDSGCISHNEWIRYKE